MEPMVDPRVYLPQDVTPRERAVLAACDRNTGDWAPAYMIAKLAVRIEDAQRNQLEAAVAIDELVREIDPKRIDRIDAFAREVRVERKRIRRWAIAAVLAAMSSMGTLAIWAMGRADAAGAAREHAANVDRQISELKAELAELRAVIWKRFGLVPDSKDLSVTLGSVLPSDFQIDDDVIPMSCDAPCTTSIQCQDAHTNCHYCYQGKCSSVLPAQPLVDGGVDAPPDVK
jgi:hypothetical protein